MPLKRETDCPGYKASNVQRTDGSVSADLTLAGSECNIYGTDLKDLKFVAEYQTGALQWLPVLSFPSGSGRQRGFLYAAHTFQNKCYIRVV